MKNLVLGQSKDKFIIKDNFEFELISRNDFFDDIIFISDNSKSVADYINFLKYLN